MLPAMRSAAVGGILLLSLCCSSLVSAEESDGTTKVSVCIAGYTTKHDVTEHSVIDKDIRDIETEMKKDSAPGFAEALRIYNDGQNSRTIDKARTLAEFWPGAHKNSLGLTSIDEPFLKMFDKYEADKDFSPHEGAVAALKGLDDAKQGNYASDNLVKDWDFRDQVAKKNIKFQIVMVYALHELEIAIEAYDASKGKDVAQRYLDVWWAFYAGSLEMGNGEKGYGPYVLAERRAKFFGTETATTSNGGVSKVNDILLRATIEISRLMNSASNTAAMRNIMKCVRAQLKVPLIQGCVMYAYKADPTTNYEPGESFITADGYNSEAARKGELWSFCSGVLPFLHDVDTTAAETLLTQVSIKTLSTANTANWNAIKAVFTATNLNKMGVKCADVGGFVNQDAKKTSATTLNADSPVCNDDAAATAPSDADSAQCTGDWMTKMPPACTVISGGVPRPGAGDAAGDAAGETSAAVGRPAATLPAMLAGLIIAGLFAR